MRNILKIALAILVMVSVTFTPKQSYAGPSTNEVIDVIAKVLMLNKDMINAIKFTIKEPVCIGTIIAKTASQDYALVGFIAALKVTKIQSIPGMPKMSGQTCKAYNPIQRAYQIIDRVGDKLLGKTLADNLRSLLGSQISEGKSQIDSQIAAIPYVGTIIGNWDCGCAAAFDTNSVIEDFLNSQVKTTVSVVRKFKSGDIGDAVTEMITGFGPEAGCKMASELVVGGIPIVSDIAAETCSGVLGKAVDWAVTAVGDSAEALGLVGGQHIPPDQYYKQMFALHVGAPNYVVWGNETLYPGCYTYFAKSNMANSTAKKVCAQLLDRYMKETVAYFEWRQFGDERSVYTSKNLKPLAEQSVFVSDANFLNVKTTANAECNSYFAQQYPHVKALFNDLDQGSPANFCDYSTLNKFSGFKEPVMDTLRKKAQQNLLYELMNKLSPSCDVTKDRNVLKCAMGTPYDTCKQQMGNSATCVKSLTSTGMEVPCCQSAEPDFGVQQAAAENAFNLAKDIGDPYCFTDKVEPYKIRCTIKELFNTCQTKFNWPEQKDCKDAKKDAFGKVTGTCCSYEPEKLETIPGVKEAKSALLALNKKASDNCRAGGTIATYSQDPRVVSCGGQVIEECKKALGAENCSKLESGYVSKTCCEVDAFATKTDELPYDPAERTEQDKALVEEVIKKSGGACYYGKTPDGKEDKFRVTCEKRLSTKQCIVDMGRPALVSCDAKTTATGYVTTPCCMKDPSVLDLGGDAVNEIEKKQTAENPEDKKKNIDPKNAFGNKTEEKDNGKKTMAKDALEKGALTATTVVAADKLIDVSKTPVTDKNKKKRKGSGSKVPGLVSIKIISVKNKDASSVNPFNVADVVKKIDPKAINSSNKAPTETAPPTVTTITTIAPPVAANIPTTVPSTPTGVSVSGMVIQPPSFCATKADGNYCGSGAKARTLYRCASGAVSSSQECYGTCNTNHCSKD